MKLYELVIVLHPSLSTEDSQDLVSKVEALFPGGVKQKDEIGYQTVYNVKGIAKGGRAYFVSYLLHIDPTILPDVRQKLSLMKGLVRTLFLSTTTKVSFHTFDDLNTAFAEKVAAVAAKDKKGSKSRKSVAEVVADSETKDIEGVEVVIEDDESAE